MYLRILIVLMPMLTMACTSIERKPNTSDLSQAQATDEDKDSEKDEPKSKSYRSTRENRP